jgi:hypothetical protein
MYFDIAGITSYVVGKVKDRKNTFFLNSIEQYLDSLIQNWNCPTFDRIELIYRYIIGSTNTFPKYQQVQRVHYKKFEADFRFLPISIELDVNMVECLYSHTSEKDYEQFFLLTAANGLLHVGEKYHFPIAELESESKKYEQFVQRVSEGKYLPEQSLRDCLLFDNRPLLEEEQIRQISKEWVGEGKFFSEVRSVHSNKGDALDAANKTIRKFRKLFGENTLEGNKEKPLKTKQC